MDVGVAVFAGSYGLAPPALGRAVEERGFESLFYAEHTHIPVASRRPDGRPVRPFAETYDPFVSQVAWGGVTEDRRGAAQAGVSWATSWVAASGSGSRTSARDSCER